VSECPLARAERRSLGYDRLVVGCRVALVVLATSLVETGCASGSGPADARPEIAADGDAPPDSAADGEVSDSRDEDVDQGPESGPLTAVMRQASVIADRLCDVDGDGAADNVIADLGEPLASLFAMTVSSALASGIERGGRLVLHIPWVEDLRGRRDPSIVIIIFSGDDVDEPDDPSDDWSGEEPFYVNPSGLDACGEPLHYLEDMPLEGGDIGFGGSTGELPFPLGETTVVIRGAQTSGRIDDGTGRLELSVCGYSAISDLGAIDTGLESVDLSVLELMIAGGAPLGVSVPGVSPDIDVDGDGLERFTTDERFQIRECIDGDLTVIPGSTCYADPRIADGFSMVATVTAVGARFAGRRPGWQEDVEGSCDGGPPVTSLFDPI
jgi:hypothetical protein